MSEIQAFEESKLILRGFELWIDNTHSMYSKLARLYSNNIAKYKPKPDDDNFHPLYVEAIQRLESVNYILDILLRGSDHEKIELYKDLK